MKEGFEGLYFKHQGERHTLALIPGKAQDGAFVQVITENGSRRVCYPLEAYDRNKALRVGKSVFTQYGIKLDIEDVEISLHGTLYYENPTRISRDIMGPFRYFPMECRHKIVSMGHSTWGSVICNGEVWDFDGGKGYIEGDSGVSFPSDYSWVHCNDFGGDCSIVASAAKIPFCGRSFWGCICVVMLNGREYRLATYRGAKIRRCAPGVLVLEQGNYLLEVTVDAGKGHELSAPRQGAMDRVIREDASCPAHFRLVRKDKVLFEALSGRASYEYSLNTN